MITRHSEQHARAQSDMKHRIAAVLIVATAAMAIAGWTGEALGQTNVKRVGILTYYSFAGSPDGARYMALFRRTLANRGWVEGKNVTFVFSNARNDPLTVAASAEALVGSNVDVVLAISAPSLRAVHAATRTVPIVGLDLTTDPVAAGYVQSYGQPGGNITGVFLDAPAFAGKWFELLKEMIPDLTRVAVLWDPESGTTHLQAVRNVAASLDITLQVIEVHEPDDIDSAFSMLRERPQALVFLPSPLMYAENPRLAKLALKARLPATSIFPTFSEAGGAIAYGPDLDSTWERRAVLVAKILDGAEPAEIPAERPAKFHLVVNLRTAKSLGITIPDSILLRADEVIE